MNTIEDDIDIYLCDVRIGKYWASYYTEYYLDKGYTHYNVSFVEENGSIYDNPYIGSMEEIAFETNKKRGMKKLYKYKLELFEINNSERSSVVGGHELNNIMNKENEIYIYTDTKLSTNTVKGEPLIYQPIDPYFYYILRNTYNFQDESIWGMKDIQRGDIQYQIIDFLYFSAVTITTLGYGDILPNSTIIRFMVMMETLVGIILIGIYISKCIELKATDISGYESSKNGSK